MSSSLSFSLNKAKAEFQPRQYAFNVLLTKGTPPTARSSFVCTVLSDSRVFINGGANEQNDLSDSYLLTISDLTWTQLDLKWNNQDNRQAPPLVGHSGLTLYRGLNPSKPNIFSYGGWNGKRYIDDGFLINIDNLTVQTWTQIESQSLGHFLGPRDSPQKPSVEMRAGGSQNVIRTGKKTVPSGRRDHTLTYNTANNEVYLIGGWNALDWCHEETKYQKVWKFQSDWSWEELVTKGAPSSRRGHTATFIEKYRVILVYGGLHFVLEVLTHGFI